MRVAAMFAAVAVVAGCGGASAPAPESAASEPTDTVSGPRTDPPENQPNPGSNDAGKFTFTYEDAQSPEAV